jgi:peptidoglycan/LPS O-acetylase OafA/YrhL
MQVYLAMRYCLRMQSVPRVPQPASGTAPGRWADAPTLPPPETRVPELDGMRGVAIVLVLLRHYIHHPSLIYFGPQWGWMGVNLFFVLSGYLITQILLRLRAQRAMLGTFYARRSLRIFPLYFIVLALYFSASAAVGHPQPWKTVLLYGTFLHAFLPPIWTHPVIVPHPGWVVLGLSVLWSLSVEEYFYLLWAPVVAWSRARRAVLYAVCCAVLVGVPWLRFLYPDPKGGQELFLAQADSLAAGCMVAILLDHFGVRLLAWVRRRVALLHAATIALLATAVWIDVATGLTKHSLRDFRIFNTTDYTVLWLAWSLWLLGVVSIAGSSAGIARVLRARSLCFLGRISSIAVSAVSWKFFEGPIARWKQARFRYRMAQQPEAPLATELAGTPYS